MKILTDWQVCYLEDSKKTNFIKATVPGNAGLDYAKAENYPDYHFSDNYKMFKWMEDKEWLYQTKIPKLVEGKKLFFVSLGIDYEFDIFLNGTKIFYQEGMFTPVDLELKTAKEGDLLEVLIKKVPKREDAEKDTRFEADRVTKPAVSYGWDWHPRLIPFGIWDDTYFEFRDTCYIKDVDITYEISEDLKDVFLNLNLELSENTDYTFKIFGPSQENVISKIISNSTFSHKIENVKLWWPNGHGKPYIYKWEVIINKTGEKRTGSLAFRKIELVNNEGGDLFDYIPGTCNMPPFTLCINNKKIFAKGTNWVNPEIFTGTITADTYKPLIDKAVECNFNMLRVWGGAIVNKLPFFELCDEKGLMVWQEFPLACNNYKGEHYLKILDKESKSIIKRYKNHVTMWCGGNELFCSWSGMDEQSLALRLLDKNCYELDQNKPYIKTSPIMNVGHGHYVFRYWEGLDIFQAVQKAKRIAYVEFGVSSLSDYEYLREIIPEEELFPLTPTKSWIAHHAFYAWDDRGWLFPETIEYYFGEAKDLKELIYYYNWLQCEGYKAMYEEARRQSPYCSMALNWCFNEPWKIAANNSLISYPCRPKPAFYAVKDSCRPVLASARIPQFDFKAGDKFMPELWLLNDTGKVVPSGNMTVFIQFDFPDSKKFKLLNWEYPEADFNIQGPMLNFKIPDYKADNFTLILEAGEYSSKYKLKLKN